MKRCSYRVFKSIQSLYFYKSNQWLSVCTSLLGFCSTIMEKSLSGAIMISCFLLLILINTTSSSSCRFSLIWREALFAKLLIKLPYSIVSFIFMVLLSETPLELTIITPRTPLWVLILFNVSSTFCDIQIINQIMIQVPTSLNLPNTTQKVSINFSENNLPKDTAAVIEMLNRERVSIEYWLEISLLYYRKGDTENFQKILAEALREECLDDRQLKRYLFDNEKERIRAMNLLAGFQLHLVEVEPDAEQRKLHTQTGYKLIEEANRISQIAPDNLVSMCFFEIAVGQLKQALSYCETCEQQLSHEKESATKESLQLLCLLARAIIEFNKGQYKESLNHLNSMILLNPKAPSDVWFAQALCQQRLGNYPKAKMGLLKTLELEANHSMAFACLGIIEITMNLNDSETRLTAAKYFQKAFESNPRNVLALKYLADHFCFNGEFAQSKQICQAALSIIQHKRKTDRAELSSFRSEVEMLRSNFYFILGKIEHIDSNFQQASENYELCLKHNSKNYECHFCMAKVQYHLGNFQRAEQNLREVLSNPKFKDSFEALRILAQIKARTSRENHPEAVKLFKRVIELNPNDYEAHFEIAQLFEVLDSRQALPQYEAGIKIIKTQIASDQKSRFTDKLQSSFIDPTFSQDMAQGMVPPELLNNTAVLLLELGRFAEARVYLDEALENCQKLIAIKQDDQRVQALHLTTRFNLGYLLEEQKQIMEATEIYKKIIEQEPTYTDAQLRLAYLAKNRGDAKRALEYSDNAIRNHLKKPGHGLPTNLHCFKGMMLTHFGMIKEAIAEFERAKQICSTDSFARAALANFNFNTSTQRRADPASQESCLRNAMQTYFGILEIDEHNCAASLGIANVLNEYGKITESNEIYKLLANSEPDSLIGHHSVVNQGHIAMWNKNFDLAVNLYKSALELQPDHLKVSLFLSKAYFRKKDYAQCKHVLKRILQLHPSETRASFNLAYCLYKGAMETFGLSERRVSQTQQAIADLNYANVMFQQILKMNEKHGGMQHTLLNAYSAINEEQRATQTEIFKITDDTIGYLHQQLKNSEQYLSWDQKREDTQKEILTQRDQALRAKEQESRDQLAREAQEKEIIKEKQREQFQKLQAGLQELDLRTQPKVKAVKQKTKEEADQSDGWLDDKDDTNNAMGGFENSASMKAADEEDPAERKRRKKEKKEKKRAKKEKRDQGLAEGEGSEVGGSGRKRRMRKTGDIADEAEMSGEAEKRQKTDDL